jgi:predicted RNA-binding Zn ribbon-like protein
LVQAFVNSRWDLNDERKGEMLVDPEALRAWLAGRELIAGRPRLTGADLERALAVREGLRALAFANNGHRADPGALEAMRRASLGAATEVRIGPAGPRFVLGPGGGLDAAIGALFAITARAMIEGSWERLKACPGRHCGWAFFDASRNQSARWCSMKVCGDREKSRAYYRRRTAGAPAPSPSESPAR